MGVSRPAKFAWALTFFLLCACARQEEGPLFFRATGLDAPLERPDIKAIKFAGGYSLFFDRETKTLYGFSEKWISYNPSDIELLDMKKMTNFSELKSVDVICQIYKKCDYNEKDCRREFVSNIDEQIIFRTFQDLGFPFSSITTSSIGDTKKTFYLKYFAECQHMNEDVEYVLEYAKQ